MIKRSSSRLLFLSLLILVAAAIRIDFLAAGLHVVDSDEAIVGLMAKQILEGGPIPVFYFGQHYMGSLEPILVAVVGFFFGLNEIALKIVPLAFSLALVVIVYRIGRELGGENVGRIAAVLTAVPPAPLVVWSLMARGGFIEIVVLCALALSLTIRWLKRDRVSNGGLAVIGFVLGLGWWTNNQIIYAMVPIAIFVALRLFRERGRLSKRFLPPAGFGILGFLVGSAPFWWYNLEHNFASFGLFKRASREEFFSHLGGVFDTALPILLGAKRFWHTSDLFPGATWIVLTCYLVVFVVFCVVRSHSLLSLLSLRINRRSPAELLLVFVASSIVIFSVSSFGWLAIAPRYLLPLYPAIFVIVAIVSDAMSKLSRPLGRAVCVVVLLLNVASSYGAGRAVPGQPFIFKEDRASVDHAELIGWLAARGTSFVETNYWIGYRLAFETGERVRFILFKEPDQIRIPSYEEEGRKVPLRDVPLIVVPSQADLVRGGLVRLGIRFQEITIDRYVVFYERELPPPLAESAKIPPGDLIVSASHMTEVTGAAIDGDATTRWSSGAPQQPGMSYEVTLKTAELIGAIVLDFENWRHDFPRQLSIAIEQPSGEVTTVMSEQGARSVSYLSNCEAKGRCVYRLPPFQAKRIVFRVNSSHPVFDWSIGELQLYRGVHVSNH